MSQTARLCADVCKARCPAVSCVAGVAAFVSRCFFLHFMCMGMNIFSPGSRCTYLKGIFSSLLSLSSKTMQSWLVPHCALVFCHFSFSVVVVTARRRRHPPPKQSRTLWRQLLKPAAALHKNKSWQVTLTNKTASPKSKRRKRAPRKSARRRLCELEPASFPMVEHGQRMFHAQNCFDLFMELCSPS